MAKQAVSPVVRIAPLGELRVYLITESELAELERGSSASLFLNFALFFLGLAIPLFFTIRVTTFPSDRTFTVFVVFFAVTLVAGVVSLALWFRVHRSSTQLAQLIRSRMPPAPAIQEGTQVVAGGDPKSLGPAGQ